MTALEILDRLRYLGVSLVAKSGKLIIEAPEGVITTDIKSQIVKLKPWIIDLLEAREKEMPLPIHVVRAFIAERIETTAQGEEIRELELYRLFKSWQRERWQDSEVSFEVFNYCVRELIPDNRYLPAWNPSGERNYSWEGFRIKKSKKTLDSL